MLKGKIVIVLLAVSLVGCGSMFYHFEASDKDVAFNAQRVAEVVACNKLGHLNTYTTQNFVYQANQLLELTVYDKDVYESHFKHKTAYLAGYSDEFMKWECAAIKAELPSWFAGVQREHRKISGRLSAARVQELNSMLLGVAGAASSIGAAAENTYVAPPSNQVTFDQPQTSGNDYLVNTSSGLVQCHVSDSGYINCY